MSSRRFSLALEQSPGDETGNKPISAFLIDKNYANYENSNPCIKDSVPKNMRLKKSRSAPDINDCLGQTCRLKSDQDKVFAVMPKRRFSICDLNTFDNELSAMNHHRNCTRRYFSERSTCPSTSISEGKYQDAITFFPKKHCRRNSVALKFQNPKSINNSMESDH